MPESQVRAPVDPDVKVPAAVKAAAAAAEQIHKQQYQTPPEEKPPASTMSPLTVVEEKPPETKPEVKETKPEPKPEPKPEVTPQSNQPTPEDWEHRYLSMAGRANAYERQNRELSERLKGLEAILATLSTAPAATPNAPVKVSAEEVEQYGADFLDVVAKRAQEAMHPYIKSLQDEIASLKGNVNNVHSTADSIARQRFFDGMSAKLPNWTSINHNPKFFEWLDLPDVYSGDIRNNLLQAAFKNYDIERVLAFFNGFLKDEAAMDPTRQQPTPAPTPAPAPQPVQKIPLEALAAPGRAKDTAANTPVEKPIISPADISKFYADVAANKFKGREAERAQMEAQIFEAQREQRIR